MSKKWCHVYQYHRYTNCIKVLDFSLYKGVSYERLCDFHNFRKPELRHNLARCETKKLRPDLLKISFQNRPCSSINSGHTNIYIQSTSGNSNPQGNEKSVRDSECSS